MSERRAVERDGITYAPGARFRVIKSGARLSGMIYAGHSAWHGWGQELKIGDVIVCTGFGPGWGGDPGYGVEFTSEQSDAAGASNVDFRPMIGVPFSMRPEPNYLEAVHDA